MKRLVLSFIGLAILAGCNNSPKTELQATENLKGTAVYGDSIPDENIIEVASLNTAMKDETKKDIKIKGKVEEVCQKKGCWMIMKLDNGDDLRVTFKDYKIFVPKDLGGKDVVLDGFAYMDTVSVDDLKHFAEDGGKSKEEIARITEPKVQLAYEAKGVVVVN